MKAAVYLRQSVDKSGNELAIGRQRAGLHSSCVSGRGWTPVEYADNDTSASTGRRPQYEQMLADIKEGVIGAVVVWHVATDCTAVRASLRSSSRWPTPPALHWPR